MLLLPWLPLLPQVVCCLGKKIKNIQKNFWKQPKICLLLQKIIKVNTQTQFQMLPDFIGHLDIMMICVRLPPYFIWPQDKMIICKNQYNFSPITLKNSKNNPGMKSGWVLLYYCMMLQEMISFSNIWINSSQFGCLKLK